MSASGRIQTFLELSSVSVFARLLSSPAKIIAVGLSWDEDAVAAHSIDLWPYPLTQNRLMLLKTG